MFAYKSAYYVRKITEMMYLGVLIRTEYMDIVMYWEMEHIL